MSVSAKAVAALVVISGTLAVVWNGVADPPTQIAAQVVSIVAPSEPAAAENTTLNPAPSANRRAVVEAEHESDDRHSLDVEPGPVVATADANSAILGQLLDSSGERITGSFASVELKSANGDSIKADILEDGTYRAVGIGPGSWWLEADAEGFSPRTLDLFMPTGQVEFNRDVELEPRAVIEVSAVTPGGQPIIKLRARITAIATNENPTIALFEDYDPARRSYGAAVRLRLKNTTPEVRRGHVGRLELMGQPPVYISLMMNETVIDTKYVPTGVTRVEFVLSDEDIKPLLSSIRYRLIDSDSGDELTATLHLLLTSGNISFSHGVTGEISHTELAPGYLELIAEVEGYESFKRSVELGVGVELDLGDIPLEASTKLEGYVFDELGNAAFKAGIHCEPIEQSPLDKLKAMVRTGLGRTSATVAWTTDHKGRFAVALSPGLQRLWAVGAGDRSISTNTIVDSSNPPVELRFVLFKPQQVVFRDQFGRYANSTVRILDEHDIVVSEQAFIGSSPITAKLPQSHYRAQLITDDTVVVAHPFQVSNTPLEIDF